MRVLILAGLALLGPMAGAQPAPKVTIEDDVSRDNAIKCHALRSAQLEAIGDGRLAPDALVRPSSEAWAAYLAAQPGHDPARVKAETDGRLSAFRAAPGFIANPASFLDALSRDCATFEIRTAG